MLAEFLNRTCDQQYKNVKILIFNKPYFKSFIVLRYTTTLSNRKAEVDFQIVSYFQIE